MRRHVQKQNHLVLDGGSFHVGGSRVLEDASQLVQGECTRFADLLALRSISQHLHPEAQHSEGIKSLCYTVHISEKKGAYAV